MQSYNPQNPLPVLEQALDLHPLIVPSDLPLSQALSQMSQGQNGDRHPSEGSSRRASCILAIENSRLAGVLTERDIVRLTAQNRNIEDVTVTQVMTRQVVSLNLSDSPDLGDILQLFRQHRIRHLPIVDDCHYPIGIVTTESIRRALQPSDLLKFWSVKDVMTEQVICAPPTASVLKISQLLLEHRVSCVVVAEPHPLERDEEKTARWQPVGIVTERDIVQFQLLELDLANTPARQVMSAPLVCLSPIDSLWTVQQQMQQLRVRRLVVTGAQGELRGIITQSSMLQALNPTESYRAIQTLRQELEDRSSQLERTNEQLQQEVSKGTRLVEKLQNSEAELRAVFEAMTDIVLTIDLQNNSVKIMPTQAILTDNSSARIANLTLERLLPNQTSSADSRKADRFVNQVRRALSTRQTIEFEYDIPLKPKPQTEDRVFWFVASISPISETAVIWVARNITERKHIERALFEEKELAQATLQSIGDGAIATDATGKIQSFNPVAEQLTGWSASKAAGRPLGEIFKLVSEETGESIENPVDKVLRNGSGGQLFDSPLLISRNGTEYAIDESVTPIRDRQGQTVGAVLVFRDVTASRQRTRQLSWEATHDLLTGLYNRRAFELQLQALLSSVPELNPQNSLCYLDLDRFKIVNDTCGHAAGDELLQQVTALFQQNIRKTDTLARLGGDEFALLLYRCSLFDAERIAEKLRQNLAAFQFIWNDRTFTIGVSIGVVAIDVERGNLEEILKVADAACYAAKAQGRNSVFVGQPNDLNSG